MSDTNAFSEANRPKKMINVIEPNTLKVLQKRKEQEEKQRLERQQKQAQQRKREQDKKRLFMFERLKQNQELQEREKLLEEERRRLEEEQQSTRLVGKFGHMINDLNTNTTNLQFTISGLDLRPTQVKVLLSNVQYNQSLKGLTMCRKSLTDVQGKQISERLSANEFLERLELEGNTLGPDTLYSLAELLKVNETVRLIDLEGNNLIKGKQNQINYKGINNFCEALQKNQTVLSVNLNGTGLDKVASKKLREVMAHNHTIILLDIENNPDMDLDDVIAIQNKLIANKQEHDDERYMEFIERKRMRREQDISGVLLLNKQTKKLRAEAIELNIKSKKEQLDQEWQQFLQKQEMARIKDVVKMEKEAGAKKKKKKK